MEHYDLMISRIINIHDTTTSSWARPQKLPRVSNGLIYMVSGSITYRFPEGDVTAQPGDVLIFPQNLLYSGEKNTPVQHFYVIDFYTSPADALEGMRLPRVIPGMQNTERLFRQCTESLNSGGMESALECRSRAYEILAQIVRQCSQTNRKTGTLLPIVRFVRQHFTQPELDVTTLTREFHITACRLRRLFHQELGISPLQYILNQRLELAQNLLRHECLPVREVALRCGFSSEFYFSRLFRQRFGMPPSKFR